MGEAAAFWQAFISGFTEGMVVVAVPLIMHYLNRGRPGGGGGACPA